MDLSSKIAHFPLGNAFGLCPLRGRHGAAERKGQELTPRREIEAAEIKEKMMQNWLALTGQDIPVIAGKMRCTKSNFC